MSQDSHPTKRTKREATQTRSFGSSSRENHDASSFYARGLAQAKLSEDTTLNDSPVENEFFCHSSEDMNELPDNCVALMVTSPPYHVGKDYDSDTSFAEYLTLLEKVFTETYRVLEPGGRAVINVANLGRRPYISLSSLVVGVMEQIGFLMRGEVIWRKGKAASGSTAWGSWRSASNPTFRDVHEYALCFSKGRFQRVRKGESTISRDDFIDATLSVWDIQPESAKRVGHPAPFPVELPKRFIELYTYKGDLVLDPFLGSGSTAVAAVQTARRFIGYDTDPEYIEIARERVEKARSEVSKP
ncbi:MAG: DNA-methyltransferase [Actinomycetota bacterium]